MKRTAKPLVTLVLSAVALACAACASVDGSSGWSMSASDASVPTASLQPVSLRAQDAIAEWQFNPYPVNDDDGYEMPPVVPLEP